MLKRDSRIEAVVTGGELLDRSSHVGEAGSAGEVWIVFEKKVGAKRLVGS